MVKQYLETKDDDHLGCTYRKLQAPEGLPKQDMYSYLSLYNVCNFSLYVVKLNVRGWMTNALSIYLFIPSLLPVFCSLTCNLKYIWNKDVDTSQTLLSYWCGTQAHKQINRTFRWNFAIGVHRVSWNLYHYSYHEIKLLIVLFSSWLFFNNINLNNLLVYYNYTSYLQVHTDISVAKL